MASCERPRGGPPVLPPDTDIARFLLRLSPEDREEALGLLGPEEVESLDRDWPSWAHEGQQVPADPGWATCVVMGGRGFGKTRAGCEWIVSLIREHERTRSARPRPPLYIALVGATIDDARKVMVLGPSGLMRVAGPWIREWRRKEGTLIFCTGAEAQLFSGHTPELLRGPEHDHAWCDELAKWEKPRETWDMLQLGLRRGSDPRVVVTTTPRPGPVLREIMAEPDCVTIGGPTDRNPHNSERWRGRIRARYAGTRLEQQELEGKLLTDSPGALWTEALLERCRAEPLLPGTGRGTATRSGVVEGAHDRAASEAGPLHHASQGPPPRAGEEQLIRLVIAVDPPTGDGTCGIVACARDKAGQAHLLADHSVSERSPEGWARAVADSARVWAALHPEANLRIVAESNQGGLMVRSVIRIADPKLRVDLVPAVQGKTDRAAPVAMLFEAGRVTVHGRFPELEAQLCGMIAGGDYEGPGNSPDRADAMVWALTELMLQKEKGEPRIRML